MNCVKCNKKATHVYRPDLDLTGVGMCSKHKTEVETDILIAVLGGGWNEFEKKYFNNTITKNEN